MGDLFSGREPGAWAGIRRHVGGSGLIKGLEHARHSEPPGVWGNEMINCHDLGKWTEPGGEDHKGVSFLVFFVTRMEGKILRER